MKCEQCGAEWTVPTMMAKLQNCPFCGAALCTDHGDCQPLFPDAASVLRHLAQERGEEFLENGDEVLAQFEQLAPEMKKERTMLSGLLQLRGNERLLHVKKQGEDLAMICSKIAQEMMDELLLSEAAAEKAVEIFRDAISSQKLEDAVQFIDEAVPMMEEDTIPMIVEEDLPVFVGTTMEADKDDQCGKLILSVDEADIGDSVLFGRYPQEASSDAEQPIEWTVLDKENDCVLLLSKYGLEAMEYHRTVEEAREISSEKKAVTWENAYMREWLNGSFLKTAFNSDEQRRIALMSHHTYNNPWFEVDESCRTNDHVFLLSSNELERYFIDNESQLCSPTGHAASQGTESSDGMCSWWIRSSDTDDYFLSAGFVSCRDKGQVMIGSQLVKTMRCARPAVWVRINPSEDTYLWLVEKGQRGVSEWKPETLPLPSSERVQIGQTITFGRYPQKDGRLSPIEWIVLDQNKETNSILVIAKSILEVKSFSKENVEWEESDLREWLNHYFFNAFNHEERLQIESIYHEDVGALDKVFLISGDEMNRYFSLLKERKCEPTKHASTGYHIQQYNQWWLRDFIKPEFEYQRTSRAYVDKNGEIKKEYSSSSKMGVRPAMWIELSSENN